MLRRPTPRGARRRVHRAAPKAPSPARRGSHEALRSARARRRIRIAQGQAPESVRSQPGCRARSADRTGRTPRQIGGCEVTVVARWKFNCAFAAPRDRDRRLRTRSPAIRPDVPPEACMARCTDGPRRVDAGQRTVVHDGDCHGDTPTCHVIEEISPPLPRFRRPA
jgi:hypothetical protein